MFFKKLLKLYLIPGATFGAFITGANLWNSKPDCSCECVQLPYVPPAVNNVLHYISATTTKGMMYAISWPYTAPLTVHRCLYGDVKYHTQLGYKHIEPQEPITEN